MTRFLYARIMLLRPLTLFNGGCYTPGPFDLESNVMRECCSSCLRSSELLVLSVRRDKGSPRSLADWHTIYRNLTLVVLGSFRFHANNGQ
jgi:hypothetical protein